MSDGFAWIIAHPVVSHSLVALGLVALIGGILTAAHVPGAPFHAAGYTSMFFYGREAEEASRVLTRSVGNPMGFFQAFWPGNWHGGGADLYEWLVPTIVVFGLAFATAHFGPRLEARIRPGREMRLGAPRPR